MRKYLIKNEMLDANVFLVVGSDNDCTKFLNEIDPSKDGNWVAENDPDIEGVYYKLNKWNAKYDVRRVIHLIKFRRTVWDVGVLAHEIQHYVNDVCLSKGIQHTRGDEETSAYLMEFTLKSCLKVLNYK